MENTVYANPRSAAQAYADIGLETGVIAASPHKLVLMLFEGALHAIRTGVIRMREGNIAAKSAAIAKAVTIISDGLKPALDLDKGGEIAAHLDALYDYMNKHLMLANLTNQTAPLEEVWGLLRELHEAWQQIGGAAAAPRASTQPIAA